MYRKECGGCAFNLFGDLVNNIQEHSECLELNPGQKKRIQSGNINSFKPYNIKRELDGSYSIPLNLRFSAADDYDGEVPKDQVPIHYMKKVQECMDQANQKMLGPNGEQLKIVIQEPTKQKDTKCKGESKNIKIGSKDHRSNAEQYAADIDCPTITHEVLHLLGLCDEYKESFRGYYVNSQTGDIVGRTENIFNADDEVNKEFSDKELYRFKPYSDCRVTTTNSIMSFQDTRWNNVFKKGTNDSLLTPGQFQAILYGGCSEKNKLFNECSQLAYKNSIYNTDCLQKKKQCENQNSLGLDKRETLSEIKQQISYFSNLKKVLIDVIGKIDRGEELEDFAFFGYEDKSPSSVRDDFSSQLIDINKRLDFLRKELKQVEAWPD